MTIQIHYRSVLSRGRQPSKIRSEDMQKGARREEEKETKCMSGKSTKTKGVTKVAQRPLGPASFMLDGMPAILGALLEENDIDSRIRARASRFSIPGQECRLPTNLPVRATATATASTIMGRTTSWRSSPWILFSAYVFCPSPTSSCTYVWYALGGGGRSAVVSSIWWATNAGPSTTTTTHERTWVRAGI